MSYTFARSAALFQRAQGSIAGGVNSGIRKLETPVPLYWVYVTAWATPDGVVQFRDDIYGRDGIGAPGSISRG